MTRLYTAITGIVYKTFSFEHILIVMIYFRYPTKFLSEITMRGDQFWYDLNALIVIFIIFRIIAYFVLRWKVIAVR